MIFNFDSITDSSSNTPIPIPEGNPGTTGIMFSIGKFEVHTYSMMILIGMLIAIATICFFWKRQKYSWELLQVCVLIAIPSGIIGARLLFVVERLIYNPGNPFPNSEWYAMWNGGLSIQGGVILAAITVTMYIKSKEILVDWKTCFGIFLPSVMIAQAIGRWGNFANHEVYGEIDPGGATSKWLGHWISSNMFISDDLAPQGAYRVPLFFYEFLTSIIGSFVIMWIFLFFNWTKPGTTGSMYLIWYGVVRVIMEPFREEHYVMYILISVAFIVLGLLSFIIFQLELNWKLRRDFRYDKIKIKHHYIYHRKQAEKMSKRSINAEE